MKVVFVLSTNYAGSHLLAGMLGAHPSCADIGELRNFHRFHDLAASGSVASAYGSNPAFHGLRDLPVTHWHRQIGANLRHTGVTTLIDNSKKHWWAARFLSLAELDVRFALLLRDPRAVAQRWHRTYAGRRWRRRWKESRWHGRRRLRVLRAPGALPWAWKWLRQNEEALDFVEATGRPWRCVTYHDLVTAPRATLEALMPSLGLEFHPDQLDPDRTEQLGTRKRAWSGRGRELDLRWRDELDPATRRAMEALPDIAALLERLGLRWVDDGLTGQAA